MSFEGEGGGAGSSCGKRHEESNENCLDIVTYDCRRLAPETTKSGQQRQQQVRPCNLAQWMSMSCLALLWRLVALQGLLPKAVCLPCWPAVSAACHWSLVGEPLATEAQQLSLPSWS
ncbi:unnamed protein product [Effrenium voratum]|nr:unnamed protein product [Effrenium voratum]